MHFLKLMQTNVLIMNVWSWLSDINHSVRRTNKYHIIRPNFCLIDLLSKSLSSWNLYLLSCLLAMPWLCRSPTLTHSTKSTIPGAPTSSTGLNARGIGELVLVFDSPFSRPPKAELLIKDVVSLTVLSQTGCLTLSSSYIKCSKWSY